MTSHKRDPGEKLAKFLSSSIKRLRRNDLTPKGNMKPSTTGGERARKKKISRQFTLKEMVLDAIVNLMINEAERKPRASKEELRSRRDNWLDKIAKTRDSDPKSKEMFKKYLKVTSRQNHDRYTEDPPVEDGSA